MVIRLRMLALGALLGALSVACHSPRCEPEEACDIRKASCQRAALRWAKCLRGASADVDVDVVTLSEDAVRADFLGEGSQSADPQGQLITRGLSLFDLAKVRDAGEVITERVRWLGAFYDGAEKRVTVVDHGGRLDSPDKLFLLVHEMVHALQDESGAFDAESPPQLDAWLARRAITEGEATVLEDEANTDGLGFDFHDLDYESVLRSFRGRAFSNAHSAVSLFDNLSMHFPYAYGASYLWEKPGYKGNARAAYQQVPVSTYAVMTDEPERFAERFNDLGPTAVPDLEAHGFAAPRHVHLGRFVFEVFLARWEFRLRSALYARFESRQTPGDDDSQRSARAQLDALSAAGPHFEADTFSVADRADQVVASWRLRFDDEATATDMELAFGLMLEAQSNPGWVGREERDVWVFASSDPAFRAELVEPLRWREAAGPDEGFGSEEIAGQQRVFCLRPERR